MPTPENRQDNSLLVPVTNQVFLQTAFGPLWPKALIAGFPGDPGDPRDTDWTAFRATCLPEKTCQEKINMYFCPSITTGTRRTLSDFVSFHVLVLDDYGTKIVPGHPEELMGEKPSYIIETSPGNYQAGWIMNPLTNLGWIKGFLCKLRECLGAGDNLTDPMAWRRLPVGINGKAKYRTATGKPWRVDLASEVCP